MGRGLQAGGRGSRRKDLGRQHKKNKPAKGDLHLAKDWSKGKGGGNGQFGEWFVRRRGKQELLGKEIKDGQPGG